MVAMTFWDAPGRRVKLEGFRVTRAGASTRGTGPSAGKIEFALNVKAVPAGT